MKPANLSSILIVTLLLLLSGCFRNKKIDPEKIKNCISASQLSAEQAKKIRLQINADEKAFMLDTLFQKKAKYQGFNGVVLVAQKGIVLYEKAFGLKEKKNKDSLTLNSVFQLASISKTFTGAGILLLAQEKKLFLTDKIQKFLPEFPYPGISIENLLSHRSGLPNYRYCFEEQRKRNIAEPNNDSILAWFSRANPLPPPYTLPGKSFSYNNTNFVLLACIIEKVSGQSYPEFIRTRIFETLGMTHTFVDTIAPDSLLNLKTIGHQGVRSRERDFYDGVYGDKGIFSSVEDMQKWYTGLRAGCILNKHWLKEAFTPRSFEHRSRHNYGLGFRLMTDNIDMKKVHYVYHGGWWAGFSTMFWTDMEADIVVIVLGNKKNNSVYQIKPILSILEQNNDNELNNIGDE